MLVAKPAPSQLLPAVQLSSRAAVAALLSVAIAQNFGLMPLQALITSVLVIDSSPEETRRLALQRFAGTVLGGLLGVTLGVALGQSALSVGFGVLAAMLSSHLLRLDGAARLSGYVCGLVLLHQAGAPWSYAFNRLLETTLGIVMAVLTSFVPKLIQDGRKA
jgi:uncharacterized membrane protein YgaE (UPF0421/DUF939 family)